MGAIQELFKNSSIWITVIFVIFVFLFAIKEIISVISYLCEKFGIKTKRVTDKETLYKRVENLEKQNEKLDELCKSINEIKEDLLKTNIERKRKSILDFCSTLSNGQKQNGEAFNEIFRIYAEYEQILKNNDMENGQAEESMKFISEKYQELLRKGEL